MKRYQATTKDEAQSKARAFVLFCYYDLGIKDYESNSWVALYKACRLRIAPAVRGAFDESVLDIYQDFDNKEAI